jgi:DNA-binding GntR family transcriptional regulator
MNLLLSNNIELYKKYCYCILSELYYNCIQKEYFKTIKGIKIMARGPLRNVAYDYLYEGIISNKLPAGHVLVEQEISDLLNISRTPVRDAIKQLSNEGLVRYLPSRGTFVEEISTQDIEEIFEIREMFEEAALRWTVNEITNEEIAEIEKELVSLSNNENYSNEYYKSDLMLHRIITKYGHNSRMKRILNTLNSQLERFRRVSAKTPNRLINSREEHLNILRALKERNIEEAERYLHLHLENVKKSTINACERMHTEG